MIQRGKFMKVASVHMCAHMRTPELGELTHPEDFRALLAGMRALKSCSSRPQCFIGKKTEMPILAARRTSKENRDRLHSTAPMAFASNRFAGTLHARSAHVA